MPNNLPNTGGDETIVAYFRRPVVLLTVISALTFLLYQSTLSFGFVWDDHMQVESNPLILSWKALPRVFQSNLWYQVTPEGSYYRPFFIVWGVLNHWLFGLRPWGWHLTNVLLHLAATCLVFVLLRRLKVEYWTAAVATLLFAVHPVHIEPVAWVSSGSDTLATILYILTFLAFLKGRELRGRAKLLWMGASWLVLAAALLTKEMALTFPVILALYLFLVPEEEGQTSLFVRAAKAIVASLPYAAVNILYLAQRVHVLHGMSHSYRDYGWLTTVRTLPVVVLTYLRVLIFPEGLNGFYDVPYVRDFSFVRLMLPLAALAVVAGLIAWWSRRQRDPLIAFFGLWIPACLIPVLYLPTFMPGDFVRDRYLYLPSIGFAFLLAKAVRQLPLGRIRWEVPLYQAAAVGLLLAAFTAGVLTQQLYWADDLLVFYRGYSVSPHNVNAVKYLAANLNWHGDPVAALPLLQQAIRDNPDDAFAHWTLALVDSELHHDQQAQEELATAVKIAPEYYTQTPDGLSNWGIALATLHQYDQAEKCLRKAVAIEPNANSPLLYLGLVLLRTNRPDEAATYLQRAASIYPNGYNIHFALGVLAQMRGDSAQAEQQYRIELQTHPENRYAKMSLGALTIKH